MSHLYQYFLHFYWLQEILVRCKGFLVLRVPRAANSDRESKDSISPQPADMPVPQPTVQTGGQLQHCHGASPLQQPTAEPTLLPNAT